MFLLIYAVVITLVSFINLIRLDHWWIRIWDFPHLQLATLAGLGLLGWGLAGLPVTNGYWVVPTGLLASLLYQGWLIFPYTPLHRRQVLRVRRNRRTSPADQDRNTLSLMVANVYMENTRCPDLNALVRKHQPDVLLVLEGNARWQQALSGLENDYLYRMLCPLENTYGLLFYSKLPLDQPRIHYRVQAGIPSLHTRLQLRSEQWVHFYGVHPMPPSPTEHYRSTERDAELMLVGREVSRLTEPVLVAGDLNDVAWSHTTRLFQRISGLLDPRVGRGLFSTFHAQYFFLRWPLDHVFVSHQFRCGRFGGCPTAVGWCTRPARFRRRSSPNPKTMT